MRKVVYVEDVNPEKLNEASLESFILRKLVHPNIISLQESYIDSNYNQNLILEYAESGTLKQLLTKRKLNKNNLKYIEIIEYLYEILSAIDYLHAQNIIHCDLRSENILLNSENSIKISDFGLSKYSQLELEYLNDDNLNINNECSVSVEGVGAFGYQSPEMLLHNIYSCAMDIWSLGCILYELVNLRHPFEDYLQNLNELSSAICHYEIPHIQSGNKFIDHMYIKIMNRNPLKRPDAQQLFGIW